MTSSTNQNDLTDPILVEPAIFWFWNDTPTPGQVDDWLDAYQAKGIRAVYVHPMPHGFRTADFHGGMTIEYLSPAFFDLIARTCESIRRRDMILWLYDEGGWPSGMAGGAVVTENPSYGIWVLDRDGDTIKPVQLLDQVSYPDLMNPGATDCFIQNTHERYRMRIGEEFGKTVRGIFTDEPRLLGRLGTNRIPWSPLLPQRFLEKDFVIHLFDDAPDDERTLRVRREYMACISGRIAENYYGRIRAWCERNHLFFEGHHSGEDDYAKHGQYFGDYLQQAKQYHIPGVDTIWRQIFPGRAGGNYVGLASSVSWLRNQRIAVSESFAVYGAGLTLEQMKWISAFQLVRGINKIVMMPSMLSSHGARRISLATDISPKNPIWADIDLWCEFLRRTAGFTIGGLPRPRVGVFYRSELVREDQSAAFNRIHEEICNRVHDALAGLVFVGTEDLARARPGADGVHIGAAIIALLIVHVDGPLTVEESKWISRMQELNVRIIRVDGEADVVDSSILSELSPIHVGRELNGVRLLHLTEKDWRGFFFFNQNAEPIELKFSVREPHVQWLREVPLDSNWTEWIHPLMKSGDGFHLHLPPGGCRAFESVHSQPPVENSYVISQIIEVNASWSVARQEQVTIEEDIESEFQPSAFKPCILRDYSMNESTTGLCQENGESPCSEYSGSLIYRTQLTIPAIPVNSRVILDIGTVYYSAEVWLNGQSIGRRAWSPFWFDVTEFMRFGEMELQIRTTNTLANQWMQPDIHARDVSKFGNMYLSTASSFMVESLHAGLAGPIQLRVYTTIP